MLESVLVPTYSEVPEPSPRTPLSNYRTTDGDPLTINMEIPASSMCACRCGRLGPGFGSSSSSSSGTSPLLVAEQRALAARLREVAEREAASANGAQGYKAVYQPVD